jgi:hypothetical protein
MHTRALPLLRDVDDIDDAAAVARDAPVSRFAETLRKLQGSDAALVA